MEDFTWVRSRDRGLESHKRTVLGAFAEEDRQARFKATIALRQAEFEEAFSEAPRPALEITMSVMNNG
jgi:hypothetical protein